MGKMPVHGLVGLFLVGMTLPGCQTNRPRLGASSLPPRTGTPQANGGWNSSPSLANQTSSPGTMTQSGMTPPRSSPNGYGPAPASSSTGLTSNTNPGTANPGTVSRDPLAAGSSSTTFPGASPAASDPAMGGFRTTTQSSPLGFDQTGMSQPSQSMGMPPAQDLRMASPGKGTTLSAPLDASASGITPPAPPANAPNALSSEPMPPERQIPLQN
ncbi:MAG: hypothetical protein JO112_21490 [Planctomycetes bacterium]|nr:hypothetical protein [Planctomycetota bacterium]